MIRIMISAVVLVAVVLAMPVQAEPPTKEQFSELALASLTYAASARACGDINIIKASRSTLATILNYGNRKKLLNSRMKLAYRDTETFLERGAAEYRKHPYVTCGEVTKYVRQISKIANDIKKFENREAGQ